MGPVYIKRSGPYTVRAGLPAELKMADEQEASASEKVQFNYIKGPLYREVPCHGVLGGLLPALAQRGVWMALYSERGTIPRLVEYVVPPGATQFDESTETPSFVDSRRGIVRHVELCAYLDYDTARRVHKWLGEQLEAAKAIGEIP